MKLVDILARELAEWPVKEGVYPQGQDYCVQSDECSQVFFCGTHGKILLSRRADKTSGVRVTRAEWQAAVDALNAPKVVEWDEFGFPPAGVSCEFTSNDGYNWKPCRILYADELSILTGELEGKADRRLLRKCDADVKFRPARTAEQVAAEERDKAAKELYMTINWDSKPGTWENLLQARRDDYRKAIDAGYRKEPKPCGS